MVVYVCIIVNIDMTIQFIEWIKTIIDLLKLAV